MAESEAEADLYTAPVEPFGNLFKIDLCRRVEPGAVEKSAAHSNSYVDAPGSAWRGENAAPFYFFNHHAGSTIRFVHSRGRTKLLFDLFDLRKSM